MGMASVSSSDSSTSSASGTCSKRSCSSAWSSAFKLALPPLAGFVSYLVCLIISYFKKTLRNDASWMWKGFWLSSISLKRAAFFVLPAVLLSITKMQEATRQRNSSHSTKLSRLWLILVKLTVGRACFGASISTMLNARYFNYWCCLILLGAGIRSALPLSSSSSVVSIFALAKHS